MKRAALTVLAALCARAEIIDRIAAIVNTQLVKDSDIERDIRVTALLNGDPLRIDLAERKKSVARLIDQAIIRREMELADYGAPAAAEVSGFLKGVESPEKLREYGLKAAELRDRVAWQITVLRFIEQRFRPAAIVTDAQVDEYLKAHPAMTRDRATEQLTGERVNEAFDNWLNRAQKRVKVQYLETELK